MTLRRYAVLGAALLIAAGAVFAARSYFERSAPVTLTNASAVPVPGRPGVLHVYLTMENGPVPQTLLSVQSAEAAAVALGGAISGDVVLPAGSTPSLSSDGIYIEMTGVEGVLEEGRLISVSLQFDRSGTATTRALIGAPVDPHAMHRAQAMNRDMQVEMGHGQPPAISMTVSDGADGGWLIALQTAHFSFAPEVEDPVHVPGEGHGHLYLNGLKLQRVYAERVEIGALPPGEYVVEVTLNTNTHMPYETEDGPVSARAVISAE